MSENEFRFLDSFEGPKITVYGNAVRDISISVSDASQVEPSGAESDTRIARIRSFRIGNGQCVPLPVPGLVVVHVPGVELTSQECGFEPGEVQKWIYPFGSVIKALEPTHGPAEEVLETLATRGIDGGVSFANPRYENGRLCVDVRIWAEIKVLGATAKFDERFGVCIDVGQQCVKVWENGFANLQACYRSPNQICGKLCVGKYGLEKCWEECVSIPGSVKSQSRGVGSPCSCSGGNGGQAALMGPKGCMDCDASVDATVHDRKVEVTLAGYGIKFGAPDWLADGSNVTVKYHGCGCYCTKGGLAELLFNGQRVACYTIWGDCDC
jgi:hypothetical protein